MSTFKITNEPEFEQAYKELLYTLEDSSLFTKRPELRDAVNVIAEPERVVMFRVPWEDDKGKQHVNRGFRVQFNSALGPYKGGLRFHETVNLSILKFLGFEQTFKNALTGLNMGGGKGGSDFSPKGRSNAEIRRFCQSFMMELQRHIGPDTDVPAGDINVTGLEIGYLFGQYKRLKNKFEGGTLTGKGMTWGGSLIRPEATGYGVVYYLEKMIECATNGKETLKGKIVLISGSGNVAQYAALKVIELGGHVVSLSDSEGSFIAKDLSKGFTTKEIEDVIEVKAARSTLKSLESKFTNFTFHAGKRPWTLVDKCDVALPCATQNEVSGAEAEHLVKAGCKYVAEGSNMGSTLEAIDVYETSRAKDNGLWYGPAKAANCGGVAVSGLEMAQNSSRDTWTNEVVDARLKDIMVNCFNTCYDTSVEYAKTKESLPSLVRGANVAGFVKVVDAMIDQGDYYHN